jgi:hypothetical protein
MNPLLLPCRALQTIYDRYGNINPLSIAYATRLGLGPTNPGTITVAQETLLFRWAGFSPALWLLIPTFSLDSAPPNLAVRLQCPINAPLPLTVNCKLASSVIYFSPVTFSAQGLLTSELLRTL